MKPDTVVISGGGLRAAAALGAAHALSGRACGGCLSDARRFVGTSAGALVAACLAVRADPVQVMRGFEDRPFVPDLTVENFGVDSGKHLDVWIRGALGSDADATFGEIEERHGTELCVCVTELCTRQAVYLGPQSHPRMPVALALRMSCSVPLAFAAVRFEEGLYVDGALRDNFPVAWALERSTRVLGIRFAPATTGTGEIATTADFVAALCECATTQTAVQAAVQALPPSSVLTLTIPAGVRSLDLGAVRPQVLRRLFNSGAAQARDFVKKHK